MRRVDSLEKTLMLGGIEGQEEKGTTEDEMAGWHHRLNGREFEWTPGVGDGQGGLACCNSWGRKESDMTEQLNWTDPKFFLKSDLSNPSALWQPKGVGWGGRWEGGSSGIHTYTYGPCIGEGNGNPLQCSCLENPRDGGAWWAAIYGVAQSRTRLKWLSSSSSMADSCWYLAETNMIS